MKSVYVIFIFDFYKHLLLVYWKRLDSGTRIFLQKPVIPLGRNLRRTACFIQHSAKLGVVYGSIVSGYLVRIMPQAAFCLYFLDSIRQMAVYTLNTWSISSVIIFI